MRVPIRTYSTIDIKALILNTKIQQQPPDLISKSKKTVKQVKKHNQRAKGNAVKSIIDQLNKKFNNEYPIPSPSSLSNINFFFNKAAVTFEWSAPKFDDIPGEKVRNLMEKRQEAIQKLFEEDAEFTSRMRATSQVDSSEPELILEPGEKTIKMYPGKTSGIPFELINGLPEIAFLGRCNTGKSTLLNNLTTEFSRNALIESAYSSKKAGFTKTLNCFNVGKKFRIIDTPGYGIKSTEEQGKVTLEYLRSRRELRRSFLLINGSQGFSEFDARMMDLLVSDGIPFELVFTKMDMVKNFEQIEKMIEGSGVLSIPTSPRFIFLNSVTNKFCDKRYGIDLLRYVIFEACGLSPDTKPAKVKK